MVIYLSSYKYNNLSIYIQGVESKCMGNEVSIEELDKNLRATSKMASDSEQKLDELSRNNIIQYIILKHWICNLEFLTKHL